MLSSLSIRDIVLIDRLDLEFPKGLCALTGETGAGKSILLDALGLGLGARADARLVRQGAEQAMVSAAFELAARYPRGICCTSRDWWTAMHLLLRRVLDATAARGPSSTTSRSASVCFASWPGAGRSARTIRQSAVNGPSRASVATGRLRRAPAQGDDCATAWRAWRAAAEARAGAEADLAQARRDEDFIRHALDELDRLAPQPGEENELSTRRSWLMNAEKLGQAIDEAARELAGGPARGAIEGLRSALRSLQRVAAKAEGRLDAAIAALDRALSEAVEGQALLERTLSDAESDPRQLETVEERLFDLRAQARKHGVAVDDLSRRHDDIAGRVSALEDGGRCWRACARTRPRPDIAGRRLRRSSASAARRRRPAGCGGRGRVCAAPPRQGAFRHPHRAAGGRRGWPVRLRSHRLRGGNQPRRAARPARPHRFGRRAARFTLALKVVLAGADPVATLMFDEVDAGVGGAVAAAVGARLGRLAGDVQVLVVTHSPQVAARADHHWRISKAEAGSSVRTTVEVLDAAGRREEIARMLAGTQVTGGSPRRRA